MFRVPHKSAHDWFVTSHTPSSPTITSRLLCNLDKQEHILQTRNSQVITDVWFHFNTTTFLALIVYAKGISGPIASFKQPLIMSTTSVFSSSTAYTNAMYSCLYWAEIGYKCHFCHRSNGPICLELTQRSQCTVALSERQAERLWQRCVERKDTRASFWTAKGQHLKTPGSWRSITRTSMRQASFNDKVI